MLGHTVEEGKKTVIITLGDRIIFVIVTLCTRKRESEKDLARRLDAVSHIIDQVFFRDRPTLVRYHVIPVKSSGYELRVGSLRQQVAGKLFNHEFVERLIGIEGVNNPIPPEPHMSAAIN